MHSLSYIVPIQCNGDRRALHSFPTRRSSDLVDHVEDRIRVRDALPERREQRRREEHAAEIRQRRQHERRDDRDVVERFREDRVEDRKSTRLNSSHVKISYAVFCLKKKIKTT